MTKPPSSPYSYAPWQMPRAQEARFTTGLADEINPGLFDCGDRSRVSAVGEIASEDGTVWTVPAATNFETAPHPADLFNECGGDELSSLSQLDLDRRAVDGRGRKRFTRNRRTRGIVR